MAKGHTLSIIIPIFNEVDNIPDVYRKLSKILDKNFPHSEIIFIDDGSTDGSLIELEELTHTDKRVKVVMFRRNFGQTAALSAGFEIATGEIIITMDGDLQNDPKDIPKLVQKVDEGYDLVSGWRKDRQDNLIRVILSKIANWIIAELAGVKLHDFGCTIKAYKQDLVKEIKLYGEMHRFIPAVAARVGAHIAEVPVRHHPRQNGSSKYGLDRTIRVSLDILMIKFLLDFQTRPIHLFGLIGVFLAFIGTGLFGWLTYEKILFGAALSNRPLFTVAIFMILIGVQFITIGILAEMLMRVYYESQDKKPYYIRKVISQ